MAADLKFRKLSNDALADAVHFPSPGILYRGMTVAVEYHDLYVKNEGSELVNPSYALRQETAGAYALNRVNAKVTGSAKDGGSTATVYVPYSAANGGTGVGWDSGAPERLGPVAIPDTNFEMAAGRCYDLWLKILIADTATEEQSYNWRHVIGGSEPA